MTELVIEAEKTLKKGWIWGGSKVEDACDLYIQAANKLKFQKKYEEAAKAFVEAAKLQEKQKNDYDEADCYISASKCMRKVDLKETIKLLEKAIQIFLKLGRLQTAAKYQNEIGEIYEKELMDLENALKAYRLASEWLGIDDTPPRGVSITNDITLAKTCVQLGKYQEALDLYEKVALHYIQGQYKYLAREYILMTVLCALCIDDSVRASKTLQTFINEDSVFSASRECDLLLKIIKCYVDRDSESFTNEVNGYDKTSTLDGIKVTLLLKIKRSIQTDAEIIV